jgi:hypothetical protein
MTVKITDSSHQPFCFKDLECGEFFRTSPNGDIHLKISPIVYNHLNTFSFSTNELFVLSPNREIYPVDVSIEILNSSNTKTTKNDSE